MPWENSKPYHAVVGIAGWSGSGKTTLIEKLIPLLAADGLRVSTLKHTHHKVQFDTPGKDSWRHREAGAQEVILAAGEHWMLMHELRSEPEPDLESLLAHLSPCDLVLVEGFKCEAIPKIEIHRETLGKSWLYSQDNLVKAVVSDVAPPHDMKHFSLDSLKEIAEFIQMITNLKNPLP